MSTLYTSSSVSWPVRQSLTEQKQKSGLFTCSAEFISPVSDTNIPTTIQTSIGSVNIFPNPDITIGTDGFKKINATGYGVWDSTISEEVFSIVAVDMVVDYSASVEIDGVREIRRYSDALKIFVEAGWVRKTGTDIPTLSRALTIISPKPWSVYIKNKEAKVDGTFSVTKDASFTPILTLLEKTTFGANIVQTSATYGIFPRVDIGRVL
jgi:hypothetical protein